MIHQEDPYIHKCEDDIDFQFSSTYAQCHWTIPEALQPFITHVKWTFEEELFDGEFRQFDMLQWIKPKCDFVLILVIEFSFEFISKCGTSSPAHLPMTLMLICESAIFYSLII